MTVDAQSVSGASAYDRNTKDRLLTFVYWTLVVLSVPLIVVGIIGLALSAPEVITLKDPDAKSRAVLGLALGCVMLALGFGLKEIAKLFARLTFSPANLYSLGRGYSLRNKGKNAIYFLSHAFSRDERLAGALFFRAHSNLILAGEEIADTRLKQQHLAAAESDLTKYLEVRPNRSEAYFVYGMLESARKNIPSARNYYDEAIKTYNNPSPPDPGVLRITLSAIQELRSKLPT